jgi:hypothetical protein
VPIHIIIASPLQDRTTGELRPIIADNAGGLSVDAHKRIQLPSNPSTRDASVGHQSQVLTTAIIIHSQHPELT